MANPFHSTSDANESMQDSNSFMLTPNIPENHHSTVNTTQKHLLYVEDYDTEPPSYNVAQQDHQTLQNTHKDNLFNSRDAGPGEPYNSVFIEPEQDTAPLLTADAGEENMRFQPTAPSIDQMEFGLYDYNASAKTKNKRWTLYRKFLAFSIFAVGITLMSAILATFDCYNSCKQSEDTEACDRCAIVRAQSFQAFFYISFILGTVVIICKVVQRVL